MEKSQAREPRSWAELLKQKEASRNMPPSKEYYVKPEIVHHNDAGIFGKSAEHNDDFDKSYVPVDPSFYDNSTLFTPLPPREKREYPKRDHGLDLISWDVQEPEGTATNPRVKRLDLSKVNKEDIITHAPKSPSFKFNIAQLIEQREIAKQIQSARSINPITNTFPTEEAETARILREEQTIKLRNDLRKSRLPKCELRSQDNLVNIITCEVKDEDAAKEAYKDSVPKEHGISHGYVEAEMRYRREREQINELLRFEKKRNSPAVRKFVREWNPILGNEPEKKTNETIQSLPSIRKWLKPSPV